MGCVAVGVPYRASVSRLNASCSQCMLRSTDSKGSVQSTASRNSEAAENETLQSPLVGGFTG
jgi:C4-type Zn-finger protein